MKFREYMKNKKIVNKKENVTKITRFTLFINRS